MPTLLPRTAMRLSEAAFWDFPLTPHKVRAEQEQKAEHKHFKRHGRKTARATALWGKRAEQPLWQAVTKRDRRRPRQGDTIITFTADQWNKQAHTRIHTHKSPRQTWKHLKCHLIAARNTHTVRELSRTLIFYTPTHSMVRIWACVCVSPSFTH